MLFFKLNIVFIFAINIYASNDFIVVVSKKSIIEQLSKNDISKLFLSKMKSFPNGEKATPIEINDKNQQIMFYKNITNKNEKQLSKYWAKMIFTGRGTPPKKVKNLNEIIEFIKKNKNAISYIYRKDLNKDLKIVWEAN